MLYSLRSYLLPVWLAAAAIFLARTRLKHGLWKALSGSQADKELERRRMELEKMKLQNERMKIDIEGMELQQKMDSEQKVFLRKSESDVATLNKPRDELVDYARLQVAHAPAMEAAILEELETKGFIFYSCPQHFIADDDKVEQAATDALQQLPSCTRSTVARLMASTDQSAGATTIYEYDSGKGELTKLVYKMQATGLKKAVALMPFGASFQCASFVKGHNTIKETVPIFEDVPREQLVEQSFSKDTYKTVYERKDH